MNRIWVFYIILGILLISGCNQATSLPTPGATMPQAAPTEQLSATTNEVLIPIANTREGQVPAGWATHTSQQCEYAISYPSEIEVTDQNPYSQTFQFKLANPDEGARNFIYVSVIAPEIQNMVKAGIYSNDVYNYDPAETDTLLNMQVGESKSLREDMNVESGFTFQRQPDAMISDHTAQTYERVQPWEFPGGTKEIRYYLTLNGCTYLIGGYMDTTRSNQPGAITEDLFHQIIATVQLMP
jgi:hypothetical protein